MGSIFKQKSGKWAIRFDVPDEGSGRKQKQIGGFAKKAEADKELKKIEAEILAGEFYSIKNITVSDFLDLWLEDCVKPSRAPATYEFYEGLCRVHIKKYFHGVPLTELRANQIERFYNDLQQKTDLSQNTIHHCHKTLRAALNKAVKWDYIKVSPITKTTAPKQQRVEMSYWEYEEIKQAMKCFRGTTIEWHVRIALLTGLREGEICALNSANIDYDSKTFRVTETAQRIKNKGIIFKPPKTDESKSTLPMSGEVERLFLEREHQIKLNKVRLGNKYDDSYDGYLSVWENGKPYDPKYVGRKFHTILKEYPNIKMIRFHDLRHSCASWLLSQGEDLKTLQKILRHADYSTTANIYSHVSDNTKREALDKLKLGI